MIEERRDFLAKHHRRRSPKNCSKAILPLPDPLGLQLFTLGQPSPHIRKRKSSLGAQRTPLKTSISPLHAAKRTPKTPSSAYHTFTEFLAQPLVNRTNTTEETMPMGRRRSSPDINKGITALLTLCDDFSDLPRPSK